VTKFCQKEKKKKKKKKKNGFYFFYNKVYSRDGSFLNFYVRKMKNSPQFLINSLKIKNHLLFFEKKHLDEF
jgi:hypothetical protein